MACSKATLHRSISGMQLCAKHPGTKTSLGPFRRLAIMAAVELTFIKKAERSWNLLQKGANPKKALLAEQCLILIKATAY